MKKIFFFLFFLMIGCPIVFCQQFYKIDASDVTRQPETGLFKMGNAGPDDKAIRVNSLYLTIGGKPVLPVMGEMHFSRIRRDQWEDCILKMKACRVTIISTYIFWNRHEEVEGQFDWEGEKDLRAFVKLCAKHNMAVFLRPGPWVHGEARNGGTPDWILRKKYLKDRSNDVVYQDYVRRYFEEIAEQLKGLYYKDGGNVIGVQLENEYWYGKAGEAHILWLKNTALSLGIDVPVYTVTGWGKGSVPPFEVVPLWGAYADAPWSELLGKVVQPENFMFDSFRDNKNIGNDRKEDPETYMTYGQYPYFTCEVGIGIQNTWHRRLVINPIDGLGMITAKLGSGSNLLGYYVFAGGTQFRGELHSTEEEQEETGYWTRVPEKSYDFQAAIKESGELSEAYRKVKKLHYFLNEEGEKLAPMMPVIFSGKKDDLQLAVRADDRSGYLFGINYARYMPKETRKNCSFQVKLKEETISFPQNSIDIPDSTIFIWPLNYNLDGCTLKYATAQLVGKVENCFLFFQNRNIPVEMAFDRTGVSNIAAGNGTLKTTDRQLIVSGLHPGKDCVISVTMENGKTHRIIILSEKEADDCWIFDHNGHRECFISEAGMYADNGQNYVFSTRPVMKVSRLTPDRRELFADVTVTAPEKELSVSLTPHPLFAGASWLKSADFKEIAPEKQRYHRFFLKEFSLDNPSGFRKVTLYIFPESDCRIKLNDLWVRQAVKPGVLNEIDLTGYIKKGENLLVADFPYAIGLKRFAARVSVEYSNYDRIDFSTDRSWMTTDMYTNPTPLKPLGDLSAPDIGIDPDYASDINTPEFREWNVSVPYGTLDGVNNVYLKFGYDGDRTELYNGYMLSADDFNSNRTWTIGLNRQERSVEGRNLRLILYKLDDGAKMFLDMPPAEHEWAVPSVKSFSAVPEYKVRIE